MRHIRPSRVRVGGSVLGALLAATLALPTAAPAAGPAALPTPGRGEQPAPGARAALSTDLHRFVTGKALRRGDTRGVRVRHGALRIGDPVGVRSVRDPHGAGATHRYAYGTWSSPWVRARHRYRELVPSWVATTRVGTLVQVDVRVRLGSGRRGGWDHLGRWAGGRLRGFHRTSQGGQGDDVAGVAVDTVRTHRAATGWQLRVTLLRRVGTDRTPVVASLGATTSTRAPGSVRTSRPGRARGETIRVPAYSQMIHSGHYPQWAGGGRAWCSPTSVAMVLGSWGKGPKRRQYDWVRDGHRQPWVDHAARLSYDHRYRGTGNWSFSTAYAGTFGLDAFVVRLRSLRAAERYVARGIPLVLSIAFGAGDLDGAPISSSDGHLLVLRGFTARGRPMVNDPAAAGRSGVRRTYSRGQLEEAWLTASAGTAYVIRRGRVGLPRSSTP